MTRRGWLLVLGVSFLWGVPYALIKLVGDELSPGALTFLRLVIAAAVLLPFAHRGALAELRGRWLHAAVVGTVQIASPFCLIAWGERSVSSSLAAILITTQPLFVALLALRMDRSERVGRRRAVGMAIAIAGVACLLGIDAGGSGDRLLGAAAILLGACGYALGALLIKRWFHGVSPLATATGTVCTSALVLLPLGLSTTPSQAPSAGALLSAVGLALGCTALASLAYAALILEIGPSRGGLVSLLSPAVAVVLGVGVLGEPIGPVTPIGMVMVVAGSWLFSSGSSRMPVARARSA